MGEKGGGRPTMRDVARTAGVGLTTVSRVVNGDPSVLDETALRVRAAITELGFRRNDVARSLRQRVTTACLGLIVHDIANPFYSTLARAVEEYAREHGHLLLTGSSGGEPVRERELLESLCARRVDGLIVVPTGADQRYLAHDIDAGLPLVYIDRPVEHMHADVVRADGAAGARIAVTHLLQHGHRRIGYLGRDPAMFTAAERYRGYTEALTAWQVPVEPELTRLHLGTIEDARLAAHALLTLADPPTALFGGNNRLTAGAVVALQSQPGLARSIALVGFDEFEFATLVQPAITVVAHDPAELGRCAAELLFARLAGDRTPPRTVILRTELIPRGSGEIRP
jgi:LacI family transcriptional regulator